MEGASFSLGGCLCIPADREGAVGVRFDERGVAYPDAEWTWDDLVNNGKKLTYSTRGQATPDVYGFADFWKNHHRVPIWVWGAGGRFWNDDYTKSLLNSPEAKKGFQFYYDLYETYQIAPHPSIEGFESHSAAFDNGQIAMIHTTRYTRPSNEAFRLGVAPIAQGPKGRTTMAIVDFVGVAPQTKHPDLAWELAKFYASEDGFAAGMEIEPRQNYYWGLSPFRSQALDQLDRAADIGDENWLNLLADSKPAPAFHPSGFLAIPDLDRVVNDEISISGLLDESVRTWNGMISDAQRAGVKW